MMDILKKGFTLIEVNLAVFIMAGGVLAMISLYTLGYRENRQSREDVASAACADDVMNRLMLALSSTNISWRTWKQLPYIENGRKSSSDVKSWSDYLDTDGGGSWRVRADPYNMAKNAFNSITDKISSEVRKDSHLSKALSCPEKPGTGTGKMTFALVAFRDSEDSSVMSISMRVVRDSRWRSLMSQPIFFTEVHFQGNMNEEAN